MHLRTIGILLLASISLASLAQAQSSAITVFLPLVQAPPPTVAGYLGGANDDNLVAVRITSTGELVLAGTMSAVTGIPETVLPGGGAGALIRIGVDGRSIDRVIRVATRLNHAAFDRSGGTVVCGPDGVVVLEPDLTTVRWTATPGEVMRCAMSDGRVAALLQSMTLLVYPVDGSVPLSINVGGTKVRDIAIDSASGLVFATGYTQAASDLKVAFLRAYRLDDGSLAWQRYGFSASVVKGANLAADSEGRQLAIGDDGMLYFAGFTDGGNSIFGRDPADINRVLSKSELIKYDAYNDPYRISGAKSLAWYGRFDPVSGTLLHGQWLLTRLDDGKGNSISIKGLAAAADGTLVVVGSTACCLQGRRTMQLFGQVLGNYEIGEPFVLIVHPAFTQRYIWTTLAAPGKTAGSSPAIAVAVTADRIAVAVNFTNNDASSRALVTTGNPVFATGLGGKDGYYVTMPLGR
ncbi:hypothetical protein [Chloroflexus sp.]|uniref:hypothetical protein n=1 Tax=Chloroflexus sp. TaxID=1904827 RepID=UPI002ADD53DC|nr:hypothetical protein [Chloroflexus sp.]